MALIEWDTLAEKVNDELTRDNQSLILESLTDHRGNKKEYRSFSDIASLKTIAKNQEASEYNQTNGIGILIETDFSI